MKNELVKLTSATIAILAVSCYLFFSVGIPIKDLSIGFLSPAILVVTLLFFVQRNKEVQLSIYSKVMIIILIILFLLPLIFLFGGPFLNVLFPSPGFHYGA